MKKILIHIGASYLQEESLKWAKEAGLYVVATDVNKNTPLRKLADEFYCISGTDVDSLVELAVNQNESGNLIGAYCSNDFGLKAVAAINSKFALKGCSIESAEIALDKWAAKKAFLNSGLTVPKASLIENSSFDVNHFENLQWPLIVKPVDSSGSRGVEYVTKIESLVRAVRNAFQFSKQILVEEFFQGQGIDTIGFMKDGEYYPCGIEKRIFSDLPYQFPVLGYAPPGLSSDGVAAAHKITEKAALALNIREGPVKADLLLDNDEFVLLELTPRFHGDVVTSYLIPQVYGIKPVLDHFQGMISPDLSPAKEPDESDLRTVLWRALLPKIDDICYDDVMRRIAKRWKIRNSLVDKRRKVASNIHTDNTRVTGFVFVELESNSEVSDFDVWFKQEFESIFV